MGRLNLSAPTCPSDKFLEGLEDLSLRPLFENNVIQNGSRRNSFADLNRPPAAAAAAPFLSFSGINASSGFFSLQCLWSQRTDGRSVNRDLGSQSSGSRSVNGEWKS
ncbi:hypothetical protein EZV62_011169 [Acer yangbiense]|uniref:Uncharacterized protein n=1 Tax=Acer yangbiense TaxID=1000413 RepID=A0A5C7I4X7_9ROSI|nr:hypothetical protein EZV62_011169 [Acer yangbiense]